MAKLGRWRHGQRHTCTLDVAIAVACIHSVGQWAHPCLCCLDGADQWCLHVCCWLPDAKCRNNNKNNNKDLQRYVQQPQTASCRQSVPRRELKMIKPPRRQRYAVTWTAVSQCKRLIMIIRSDRTCYAYLISAFLMLCCFILNCTYRSRWWLQKIRHVDRPPSTLRSGILNYLDLATAHYFVQ